MGKIQFISFISKCGGVIMYVSSLCSSIISFPSHVTSKMSGQVSKIPAKIIPYYHQEEELRSLRGKISLEPNYKLCQEDVSQLKSALTNCQNIFGRRLFTELKQLPISVIEDFFVESLETDSDKVIQKYLECLLSNLDEAQLIEKLEWKPEEISKRIKGDSILKKVAVEGVLKTKAKSLWKIVSYETPKFIHHIIETFICACGYMDVGGAKKNPAEVGVSSMYQAKATFELYFSLIAFPSVVYAAINSYVGSTWIAAIATSVVILSSMVLISLYMRYLKPCPTGYAGLENVTENILKREEMPKYVRTEVLEKILTAIKTKKGVILVGESGVGKTSIIHSLAERILSQNTKGLLDNAQLFAGTGNQFIPLDGQAVASVSYTSLTEVFYKYREKLVFFIDEIHPIFIETLQGGSSAAALIAFRDHFNYIIGATTKEHFVNHIEHNEEFERRFIKIKVPEMKYEDHEAILYDLLHYYAPNLIVDEGIIKVIIDNALKYNPIEKANKDRESEEKKLTKSKTDAAISLLHHAVAKALEDSFTNLEVQIADMETKKRTLERELNSSPVTSNIRYTLVDQIDNLESNLRKKKADLETKQEVLAKIRKIEEYVIKIKNLNYGLATQAMDVNNSLAKHMWLSNSLKLRILSKAIYVQREKLGLNGSLNIRIVNELLGVKDKEVRHNSNDEPSLNLLRPKSFAAISS